MTRHYRLNPGLLCTLLFLVVASRSAASERATEAGDNAPRLLANLENKKIAESSGLATSNRHSGLFWTHNDSGDKARLFAFDSSGKHRGTSHLRGVKAQDWEDMGSFVLDGKPYLFVADTGDNATERKNYVIYVVQEPRSPKDDVPIAERIVFTYADGKSRDCEAVALDITRREFLLCDKDRIRVQQGSRPSVSNVWRLKWNPGKPMHRAVAEQIASIEVPPIKFPFAGDGLPIRVSNAVTGLDVSPDGRRLVVGTYGECIAINKRPQVPWEVAFQSKGRRVRCPLPPARIQGESVCWGADGTTIYLTSEKKPCPLFAVPVSNDAGR